MYKLLTLLMLPWLFSSITVAQDVVPIKKFSGVIRSDELRKFAPQSGMIAGRDDWKTLWTQWALGGPLPQVDFESQIVLVTTVDGPNRSFVSPMKLNEGQLGFRVVSTKMGGPGFGYLLMIVPRDGIRSINGQPILPAPQAAVPVPAEVPDSIVVEVVGNVQTGVAAIGGETTGTVITSNGVRWELDFQSALQVATAKQLNGVKARVRGTFVQVQGTEVGLRSIVIVDSISIARIDRGLNQVDSGRNVALPNRTSGQLPMRPVGQEGSSSSLALQRRMTNSEDHGALPGAGTWEARSAEPPIDIANLRAYKSIKIQFKSTGDPPIQGVQTIERDGQTRYQSGQTTDAWTIEPNRLSALHALIETTDWSSVPRLNRSGKAGAVGYTIEIKRVKGTTRIFVDSGALNGQSTLVRLFKLIARPRRTGQSN